MDMWRVLVEMHRGPDWSQLVVFYGIVLSLIVFGCLQFMLIRGRRLALRAVGHVRRLLEDVKALTQELDDLERRVEKRFDSRTTELDARMTRKIDQKGDLIEERVDQGRSALSESISKLDARVSQANERVEAFKERLADVDRRIPSIFDRLDEFRDLLASTFRADLGTVLNSFDSSVSAVLVEMKSELQLGISRIESIESMVRSRQQAEQTLLGAPSEETGLPGEVTDGEAFEEWEREARELAEEPEEAEPPYEDPGLEPASEQSEYPAEMTEDEAERDGLEAELYASTEDEPELGDDEAGPDEE